MDRGTVTTRFDTTAGVVVVRNSGEPEPWAARLGYELGETGGLAEPGPEEFGRINSVALDRRGRLYVADAQAREIRVFDPGGSFLATWGRSGEGPGEFGAPYSLGWLGDTLAVLDPRVGRIGLFDLNGSWLGQRPYPGGVSGSTSLVRFYPTGRAEFYVLGMRATPSRLESRWVRHTPAGEGESLSFFKRADGISGGIECPRPDGAISFFQVPFAPRLIQTPGPGGRLAVAWTAEYRVTYVGADGDRARVVERTHSPVPVGEAEWEESLAEYRQFRREWPGARCSPRMPGKPATKPAIANLYHDRLGRLWVEAITGTGPRFDVFERDGRLIGQLPTPPYVGRVAPYLDETRMAVVVADSLGVQRVRVLELEPPGSR